MGKTTWEKTRHPGIQRGGPRLYRVRVTINDPRSGKRKARWRKSEGTLEDAVELRQRLRDELLGGPPPEQVTLSTFARQWLLSRAPTLRPSSRKKYAEGLELHILPALGDLYVHALRPSDVRTYVAREKGAPRSVAGRLRLLRQLAADTVAEGLAERDWTARVKPPPAPDTYSDEEPNLLTPGQLDTVLTTLEQTEPQWYALVFTMASTGMRWSEVSALRWEDIDEAAGKVRIRRANWKGYLSPSTKTSKYRSAALESELAEVLRAHRRLLVAQQHPGLAAGWIFAVRQGKRAGQPYKASPLPSVFKRALPRAGISIRLTPHGFRRTFNDIVRRVASRLVAKAIVGHATDTQHEHYARVDVAEKAAAQAGVLRLARASRGVEPSGGVDRGVDPVGGSRGDGGKR